MRGGIIPKSAGYASTRKKSSPAHTLFVYGLTRSYNPAVTPTRPQHWICDLELGKRFVQQSMHFPPDYDGEVTATLVRNEPLLSGPRGAVLYLHGFIDYFFQSHVADAFNDAGYNFYALDLRKYGRSMAGAAHPNFCKDFGEYFPEITSAIDIITTLEHHASVILNAHSTGALAAILYAKIGDRRNDVASLILNSPFLELPQGAALSHFGGFLGLLRPFGRIKEPVNPWYGKSLHVDYKGEWRFNKTYKPFDGFDAFYGWLRAVVQVQDRIKKGMDLQQPVLVMHSDKSEKGRKWSDTFHRADLVLDVKDIKRLSSKLGTRVECREIAGAKHDLVLSCEDARTECLRVMIEWLAKPSAREDPLRQ
jgi:alpha-beta hydrolase superfamily lysophospholipase